jgi:hypothetical protein
MVAVKFAVKFLCPERGQNLYPHFERREGTIAAAGDEVQMLSAVVALEVSRHTFNVV